MIFGRIQQRNRSAGMPVAEFLGQGLQMNSTQYASVSGLSGVAIPNTFTLLVWYRNTALLTSNISRAFLGMTDASGDFLRIGYNGSTPLQSFVTKVGAGSLNSFFGDPIPNDFQIHLLAYKYSGGNISFSIDGGGFYGSQSVAAIPTTFRTVDINRDNADNSRIQASIYGEFRLLGDAITDNEIRRYWNKGRGSKDLDIKTHLLYHRFEGNGNDSSGNNRNLTLVNSPSFTTF